MYHWGCVCLCGWITQEDEYLSGCLNRMPLLISPLQSLPLSHHPFRSPLPTFLQNLLSLSLSLSSTSVNLSSPLAGRLTPPWQYLLSEVHVVNLRLLFPCGNSQTHGHRQVVGEAGQLGDEAELLDFLQVEKNDHQAPQSRGL